ncbi:nucleotide sugar dehydrogenase [Methanococcus voltae]|uniref:UDP-N-acetyl-D-mannosamine dehydrogenase n=1 Tax=Methanococcus voltae TaxID=2188 RepID=A0A8J7RM47_METVO|nr:nucleotide sugar dehydrogenase [Methanococcus voltae]MBP2172702.1 UDP-N-acetyl-D-mannosaminuronic acid dehydrogenase [Methanococcus voltae]MBP2201381.1 UDP-N-acetyl-D-mannosaminuronic acid dehydrogenase [Methanococcus voltae]
MEVENSNLKLGNNKGEKDFTEKNEKFENTSLSEYNSMNDSKRIKSLSYDVGISEIEELENSGIEACGSNSNIKELQKIEIPGIVNMTSDKEVNSEIDLRPKQEFEINNICVVGLGYIGLPTASMLANYNYNVLGVDIDQNKVNQIKNGSLKIEEPGLATIVKGAINSKNLTVNTQPASADVFIICVPTPARTNSDGSKSCDLKYINSAVENIRPYVKDGNLVIIESTITPGTTEKVYKELRKSVNEIYVAHCPERVIPGRIIKELSGNDRIIGGINQKSAEMAKNIYKSFVEGNIYTTNSKTAEMVKLMENTYRDINIALANEFSKICDEIGVNVWEAIDIANKHPRVNILNPGPGVGGHCISIDPWFIVEVSDNAKFIKSARELNDNMPNFVFKKVEDELRDYKEEFKLSKKDMKICIFGATYKGNVEDTRESPSEKVVDLLTDAGYKVMTYDPHAELFKYPLYDLETCVLNADCILVLTDHDVFKETTSEKIEFIESKIRNKHIIDTKNILNQELWEKFGFKYKLLGNGRIY